MSRFDEDPQKVCVPLHGRQPGVEDQAIARDEIPGVAKGNERVVENEPVSDGLNPDEYERRGEHEPVDPTPGLHGRNSESLAFGLAASSSAGLSHAGSCGPSAPGLPTLAQPRILGGVALREEPPEAERDRGAEERVPRPRDLLPEREGYPALRPEPQEQHEGRRGAGRADPRWRVAARGATR